MIRDHRHLYFVVTGRECADLVEECFVSMLEQNSTQWMCIYVDDASSDDSYERARKFEVKYPSHFRIRRNSNQSYKAVSFLRACAEIPHDGVVAEVDIDDRLCETNCVGDLLLLHSVFDVIWTQHSTVNKTNLPWNTWKSTSLPAGWNRLSAPGKAVWDENNFPGHLRTFKRCLLTHLRGRGLRFRGRFPRAAWDMVYYTSLLELVPNEASCFFERCCFEYRIWPHNEEFLEHTLINNGISEEFPDWCQTTVDEWFKNKLPLSRLEYRRTLRAEQRGYVIDCLAGGRSSENKVAHIIIPESDFDRLSHLLRDCRPQTDEFLSQLLHR